MHKIASRIALPLITIVLIMLFSISSSGASPNAYSKVGKTASSNSTYTLMPAGRVSAVTSPDPVRSNTAVAYNDKQDEYLVAWSNEWPSGHKDVYARRVKGDGTILSWFAVAAGANDKYDPAVVYNSVTEEYLVIWLFNPPGGGNTNEVWGRLVSWNGATFGPEFMIASWPNRLFADPSVAWNSNMNQYLAVWGAQDATSLMNLDISSMLLSASGGILTGRNLATTKMPYDPDVVFNSFTNEYFVVYTTFTSTTQQDITGLRVKYDNSVIDPPGEISIVSNNISETEPSVATDGDFDYFVVWQSWISGDHDIYGQRLYNNGNKNWNMISIAITSGIDERSPDISYDSQDTYLITWQRFDSPVFSVRAQSRDFDTDSYEYFNVASDAVLPVVAAGPSQFLVAFQGIYPSGGSVHNHIFGRFLLKINEIFLPIISR